MFHWIGSRGRNLNLTAINSLNDNYCPPHREGAALSIVISQSAEMSRQSRQKKKRENKSYNATDNKSRLESENSTETIEGKPGRNGAKRRLIYIRHAVRWSSGSRDADASRSLSL